MDNILNLIHYAPPALTKFSDKSQTIMLTIEQVSRNNVSEDPREI